MFVALYEFVVHPGKEARFRAAWRRTTEGIYRQHGSLGSRLHSTDRQNVYVAYAQWPSREKWQQCQEKLDPDHEQANRQMQVCLKQFRTVYEFEVTDDHLAARPYQGLDGNSNRP